MQYDSDQKILKILLVDDDEDDRQILHEAIQHFRLDLTLHSIPDGKELMHYLKHCNGNTPDLIFLDLNMPRKNGMECLVEIRTDANLDNTVIAIYSTSSDRKEIDNALLAGANIFITKPHNFEALKKIVAEVLTTNLQHETTSMKKEYFMMLR